ncbi:hypothetical protein BT96DRAFT_1008606 [Gymnopus androsaceus JB14]|uniref:Uncharacterized protein n=1 Tax=Gymnopus androsaceus JB14 TaxID=1447944 RepID=A0A6A4GET0_9AGAR|nr:hypothetical protein BT96DRAFT_1008606 [Gymnopus androsaceus JB14]
MLSYPTCIPSLEPKSTDAGAGRPSFTFLKDLGETFPHWAVTHLPFPGRAKRSHSLRDLVEGLVAVEEVDLTVGIRRRHSYNSSAPTPIQQHEWLLLFRQFGVIDDALWMDRSLLLEPVYIAHTLESTILQAPLPYTKQLGLLKLAETLPDDLVMSFSKVDSVDILKTWMPPPSSWSFECGEEVAAIPFDGGTLALEFTQEVFCELSIEDASQREGKLLEILPLYCRKMRLGDTVQLLAGVRPIKEITRTPVENTVVNMIRSEVVPLCGKQGLVVAVSDRTVDVWIPEIATTLSLHPNTLCNLSLNTIAVLFIPWPPFAKFHIGNNEQAIPTNPLNLVLNQSQELDTVSRSAEPGLSRLPYFTGKSPWEDILVTPVGRLQCKGYRGWVKEVKQDEKRISGIAVLIEYQTSNMTDSPREWFDYDVLRRCDNHRFIHDNYMGEQRAKTQHKGVTYYDFKEGYVPKYTLEEEKEAYVLQKERSKAEERQHQMHQHHIYVNEILAQSNKTRSQWINERQELLRQAGADLIRDETTGLYYLGSSMITDASSQTPNPYINDSWHESIDLSRASSPTPLPSVSSHWLLDPRIREGLGDNDLLLAFKGEKKDRRVCLRVINGLTEAYSAIGHKRPIQVQDLVEDFRSYRVTKPFRAAGLYLVCEGDHIGKLVHRASEYYGNNGELYKDPLWTVQVVSVVKENGKFVETIMMDYPRFHLHGASLAEVHESRERRTSGNAAMTVLREQRDHVYTNGFWTDDDGEVSRAARKALTERTSAAGKKLLQPLTTRSTYKPLNPLPLSIIPTPVVHFDDIWPDDPFYFNNTVDDTSLPSWGYVEDLSADDCIAMDDYFRFLLPLARYRDPEIANWVLKRMDFELEALARLPHVDCPAFEGDYSPDRKELCLWLLKHDKDGLHAIHQNTIALLRSVIDDIPEYEISKHGAADSAKPLPNIPISVGEHFAI